LIYDALGFFAVAFIIEKAEFFGIARIFPLNPRMLFKGDMNITISKIPDILGIENYPAAAGILPAIISVTNSLMCGTLIRGLAYVRPKTRHIAA